MMGLSRCGIFSVSTMFNIYIRSIINYNPFLLLTQIWSLHTQNLVETVGGVHLGAVDAICFHPEHPVLVTGSRDGTVCLWNPTTLR